MDKIICYSVGIVAMSICAEKEISTNQIEKFANTEHPLQILKWKISKDKCFKSGETNPCNCEQFPNDRKHYLLNC